MAALTEVMRKAKIPTHSSDKRVVIEFFCHAPQAKEVYLAGGFNNWDPRVLLMKKDKPGRWKTTARRMPG